MTSAFRPVHELAADDEVEFAGHALGSLHCLAAVSRRMAAPASLRGMYATAAAAAAPPRNVGATDAGCIGNARHVRLQSALPAGGHSDACR